MPQAVSRGCSSRPAEGSSHCGKQAIAVLEQVLELSWSRFYGHACSSVLGGLRRRIWSSMPAYSVVDESETRVRLYLEKEKKRQPGLTKTGELRLIWAEAWREICFGFSFPLN